MLLVVQEDLLRQVGKKEGIREMRIDVTTKKGDILVQGKDRHRHIDQCQMSLATNVMIGGIRS